tara:strand:- start:6 stop:278 length:273 start_codon:yes stop_codon:yes gene_type:complete
MSKEVNLYIRYNKKLKSGKVNVSHGLALKYGLKVGDKLLIKLDDGTGSQETMQRAVTIEKVKRLDVGAHIESSNVRRRIDGCLMAYTVEL